MAADTTVITQTFPDTTDLESYWQDYCTAKGLTFTDAADAETQGAAHILATHIAEVCTYRANLAAATEKSTVYDAQFALLEQ